MSIYDTIEAVFAAYSTTTGIPYDLQGFDTDETQPDKFFIYRVTSDSDTAHYDNRPKNRVYKIQVTLFFVDKDDLKTWPDAFETAMIAAGWLPQGNGKDVDQVATGHYGWTKDYQIFTTRS